MTGWQDKHARQLEDYFGGWFKGRMGARSWMGPMLEHAQSAGLHPVDRSKEYMPVAPVSHEAQRGNAEIGEDALKAAREERHIRAALRRLSASEVHILRLAYTPQPRGAALALVVHLVGTDRHAALVGQQNAENAEVRREARRALAGARRWAEQVQAEAQAAYAAAEAQEAGSRGGRTARAFAASLGVA